MHGIAIACQVHGVNTTPEQRSTIENMPHWLYLTTSYYEKWLYCYEKILEAKGVVTAAEIERRVAANSAPQISEHPAAPAAPSDTAKIMHKVIYGGTPHDRPLARPCVVGIETWQANQRGFGARKIAGHLEPRLPLRGRLARASTQ